MHHVRNDCRACGAAALERVMVLGPQPLANANLRSPAEIPAELTFPLDLYVCRECGLVQLADVIDPEVLFRNYIYVTGTSETIAAHNRAYAATVRDVLSLQPGDRVAEVASNDGSLLRCFQELGCDVLGIEPATNIARMAEERGVPTLNRFFGEAEAKTILADRGPARAVIGNNVLAHVDDTAGFLRGAAVLAPDGMVITEVPWAGEMLDRLEYDTIYHEHLCYFSVAALCRLCEASGLRIARVDHVPVHGGSVRMYARAEGHQPRHGPAVLELVADEQRRGLTSVDRWRQFARDADGQRAELLALLRRLKAEGQSVAAYGAPAKGNTLLNYCGITADLVPYTVDKSPLKVGTLTPGMHLPVLAVETLLERQPDYLLILAWNFAEEIMRQQSEYRARGGRFIIPIPRPEVVA